jgi:tungstate transport system substrate-binding protein
VVAARRLVGLAVVAALAAAKPGGAEERFITLASTTSTENSGLLAHIVPLFERETGIAVRVVAVGTGQAIRLGENGDADVLLVHHTPSEERFVAEGHGVERFDVMYNDLVIVGPEHDPAAIGGLAFAVEAFAAIAHARAPFASRGDDSGTHKAEAALWAAAGVDVAAASGGWYRELGAGMGATLNTASALGAYALSDRATWATFANRGPLVLLVHGDPALFNQYGVILVDPVRHPHVKAAEGRAFIAWLLSPAGQAAIASFRVGGEPLFFPNAATRRAFDPDSAR